MSKKNEHKEIIVELAALRETEERDPAQASRGRVQFLQEAKRISEEPVSISWFQRLSSVFQTPQMRPGTLTLVIILGLLFVSFTTSTAVAGQALPNQFLYPYKIWLEDQRLALTIDPEKEAELHLIYAQERLAELEAMQDENHGTDIDEILENYQHHLNSAEDIFSEHQEYLEQEDLIHQLETQAPHPSPENEDELEEHEHEPEDEPEETPEPDSTDESGEEEEETESSGDPEETESPDETESSGDPEETPEPEETDSDDDETEDPGSTEEPGEPDDDEEPDETEEPEETPEP